MYNQDSKDNIYQVRQSLVKKHGYKLAVLYAVLESLLNQHGYCHPSNRYLSQKLNKGEMSIEKGLRLLEDKGLICRDTKPIGRGCIRHITLKQEVVK